MVRRCADGLIRMAVVVLTALLTSVVALGCGVILAWVLVGLASGCGIDPHLCPDLLALLRELNI